MRTSAAILPKKTMYHGQKGMNWNSKQTLNTLLELQDLGQMNPPLTW